MDATVQETFGLLTAIVVLAALSVAIINGGKTAQVIGAAGGTFTNSLKIATRGGRV